MAKIRDWLPGLVKLLLEILTKEGVIPPLNDEQKDNVATKVAHAYVNHD